MSAPWQPKSADDLTTLATQMRDWGKIMKASYDGLVEAGFSEAQAIHLTSALISNAGAAESES